MLCGRHLVQVSLSALLAFFLVLPGTTDLSGQPPAIHRGDRVVARRGTTLERDSSVADQIVPPTRAVVLVDARLHAPLAALFAEYAREAGQRRGFTIAVEVVTGLDDLPFEAVRERLRALRHAHSELEGVLFVGNVCLPSLYSPRGDNTQTRYLPQVYQDLDLVLEQRLVPTGPDQELTEATRRIPAHDFDWLNRGAEPGVELWAAFLPVGLADPAANSYEAWARQLSPFLRKAIDYHTRRPQPPRRLYKVSNQLWDLAAAWTYYGPQRIDFYATNPLDKGTVAVETPADKFCPLPAEQAYVRSPMERFASWEEFETWYRQHEWMGEGWQKDAIYLEHMNRTAYDVAWVNVHSCENFSLVSSEQARSIRRGALVMMLSGCGVGGYRQPGHDSFVDTEVAPEHNILCAYVYGASQTLACARRPVQSRARVLLRAHDPMAHPGRLPGTSPPKTTAAPVRYIARARRIEREHHGNVDWRSVR